MVSYAGDFDGSSTYVVLSQLSSTGPGFEQGSLEKYHWLSSFAPLRNPMGRILDVWPFTKLGGPGSASGECVWSSILLHGESFTSFEAYDLVWKNDGQWDSHTMAYAKLQSKATESNIIRPLELLTSWSTTLCLSCYADRQWHALAVESCMGIHKSTMDLRGLGSIFWTSRPWTHAWESPGHYCGWVFCD